MERMQHFFEVHVKMALYQERPNPVLLGRNPGFLSNRAGLDRKPVWISAPQDRIWSPSASIQYFFEVIYAFFFFKDFSYLIAFKVIHLEAIRS